MSSRQIVLETGGVSSVSCRLVGALDIVLAHKRRKLRGTLLMFVIRFLQTSHLCHGAPSAALSGHSRVCCTLLLLLLLLPRKSFAFCLALDAEAFPAVVQFVAPSLPRFQRRGRLRSRRAAVELSRESRCGRMVCVTGFTTTSLATAAHPGSPRQRASYGGSREPIKGSGQRAMLM